MFGTATRAPSWPMVTRSLKRSEPLDEQRQKPHLARLHADSKGNISHSTHVSSTKNKWVLGAAFIKYVISRTQTSVVPIRSLSFGLAFKVNSETVPRSYGHSMCEICGHIPRERKGLP